MTTILLVDDQAMIRVGLRTILEAHDDLTVVGEAGDGFEALRFLETTTVDVVLLDVRMPGIDGVETTRRLRERFSAEQLRIVILTTFEQDEIVVSALRAGANGFLGKTVGPASSWRASTRSSSVVEHSPRLRRLRSSRRSAPSPTAPSTPMRRNVSER